MFLVGVGQALLGLLLVWALAFGELVFLFLAVFFCFSNTNKLCQVLVGI